MILNSLREAPTFLMIIFLTIGIVLALLGHAKFRTNTTPNSAMRAKTKQRVLIVENKRLLGAGVEKLLSQNTNLQVMGISPLSEEELITEIRNFKPSVIILDESTYLTHTFRLLALLRKFNELRLVVVNANNNLIHVYHKQHLILTKSIDFINVVLQ